jgi:hypothetical protein
VSTVYLCVALDGSLELVRFVTVFSYTNTLEAESAYEQWEQDRNDWGPLLRECEIIDSWIEGGK